MNDNIIKEIKTIELLNDYTGVTELATVLKQNNIKATLVTDCYQNKYERVIKMYTPKNETRISATYNKEMNVTLISITQIHKPHCTYCQNGNCILENISCDGYSECKGGASI